MGSPSLLIILCASTGHKIQVLTMKTTRKSMLVVLTTMMIVMTRAKTLQKILVRYRNSNFIIGDGCPNNDPVVRAFYNNCLETHQDETLCMTDRLPNGFSLTLPILSNICSAICQGYPQSEFTPCPRSAQKLMDLPPVEDAPGSVEEEDVQPVNIP